MKSEKNSFVVNLRLAVSKVFEIMGTFTADCVTVYAAQATFYIIMSSIPFLMLLISLSRYVIPEAIDSLFTAVRQIIPDKFTDLFTVIYNEINNHAGISILSITALTALWSSSRSVAAVVRGVAFIYDTDGKVTPMRDLLYSILYTLAFVAIILGALVILVFGATIKNIVIYKFPRLENVVSLILSLRGVFFFVVLSLFFSLVYFAVSKGIIRSSGTLRKYRSQLPGAAFASAGWMLFSYFYSLYLQYFPSASYIYGSLAAIMLLMFWLYFCMIILLAGAEINKLLYK